MNRKKVATCSKNGAIMADNVGSRIIMSTYETANAIPLMKTIAVGRYLSETAIAAAVAIMQARSPELDLQR